MIEVRGLAKHYGVVRALDGVDLRFEDGKIYGLLGRNGAGKTTLLNAITGRIFADAGSIAMNGAPLTERDEALGQIYMLSEDTLYPEGMRVASAFKWSAQFYPEFSADTAHSLAEQFKLDTRTKVRALSTGYNTIFKLIIALASGAPHLLLDEPVLGLDANHRDLFYKLLLEQYAKRPCCVVLSTHLVEEVSPLVEHVVIIKNGRVIKDEPRESLLAGGHSVSGPAAKVDAYTQGKELLGQDSIGGLKSAYLAGPRLQSAPEGLEVAGMDLQRLFIQLTND